MADNEEAQQVEAGEIQEPEEAEQETEELEEDQTPKAEEIQTPKAEQAKENPKPGEIKVIILMKGDRVMLGVQSPSCDPLYKTSQGTMADALQMVPALVAEAKLKWEANPRYPKADLPTPPPSTAPARTTTSIPAKPKAQPSFF